MEIPIIGLKSKTQTPSRNGLLREVKIIIDWKSHPFPEETEEY